jgi:hypothetical protein
MNAAGILTATLPILTFATLTYRHMRTFRQSRQEQPVIAEPAPSAVHELAAYGHPCGDHGNSLPWSF